MELEYKTVTAIAIDYGVLEEFVQDTYGVTDFNIASNEECGNDSTIECDAERRMDKWQNDAWTAFLLKNGNANWSLHAIMNKLCQDGHIPAGKVYVRVSW